MARGGKSPSLGTSKAGEVALKYTPFIGVRNPVEGAGRVWECLFLLDWVCWGLYGWTRRADTRAAH